ncbi:MAG: hypothetical protein HKM02_06325 [Pseudomonadales bacterium]|nr:hypothetical protein [Pseudomonadales bacterium]
MKWMILLCLMGISACSYERREHYPATHAVVRLVVSQRLDAGGQPRVDTSELSRKVSSVYADLWVYDGSEGEHTITCRLYSLHGQLRDEQELAAIARPHVALHRMCSFTLQPYDPPGSWSLHVLMDGQPLIQRRLAVNP